MTNNVHALFYSQSAGLGFGFAQEKLQGLFETRELAEKRLLEDVLSGLTVSGARIDELTVERPYDPRNPENYPDVIAALIEQKKIQAIKRLREQVPGLGLREAKDLVEAVDLDTVPTEVKEKAIKVIDDAREAERAEQQVRFDRVPFAPVVDWAFYTWLRDGEGDIWAHVGDGDYVLLNDLGGRDEFQTPLSEDEIDSRYGIKNRSDERDEV